MRFGINFAKFHNCTVICYDLLHVDLWDFYEWDSGFIFRFERDNFLMWFLYDFQKKRNLLK